MTEIRTEEVVVGTTGHVQQDSLMDMEERWGAGVSQVSLELKNLSAICEVGLRDIACNGKAGKEQLQLIDSSLIMLNAKMATLNHNLDRIADRIGTALVLGVIGAAALIATAFSLCSFLL